MDYIFLLMYILIDFAACDCNTTGTMSEVAECTQVWKYFQ